MKIKVSLIIICLLAVTSRTGATGNRLSFPSRQQVAAALQTCMEHYGPLTVEEGEVTAVGTDWLGLRGRQGEEKTFSSLTAKVFVNGYAGHLPALCPIAPGFYFAARLYFDQQGILRLVDGWYVGAEVEVLAVEAGGRRLTVQPLDQAQTYQLILSPQLASPGCALAPGSICFLLLDWEHCVRKILWHE